jgi:hypothetical protein
LPNCFAIGRIGLQRFQTRLKPGGGRLYRVLENGVLELIKRIDAEQGNIRIVVERDLALISCLLQETVPSECLSDAPMATEADHFRLIGRKKPIDFTFYWCDRHLPPVTRPSLGALLLDGHEPPLSRSNIAVYHGVECGQSCPCGHGYSSDS